MKAILRITKGITTKKLILPNKAKLGWSVPIYQNSSLREAVFTKDMPIKFEKNIPILIFQWDGRSFWGDKNVEDPIYILDLTSVSFS